MHFVFRGRRVVLLPLVLSAVLCKSLSHPVERQEVWKELAKSKGKPAEMEDWPGYSVEEIGEFN